MECELCGRSMVEGMKVRVEGSIVTVCDQCSEYGEAIKPVTLNRPGKKKVKKRVYDFSLDIQEELIEDYGIEVKNARERKNMKQEELARKINEPVSVIKKIESGRLEPNTGITRKIEKTLSIKLMKKTGGEETKADGGEENREMTLGDIMVVKKKNRKG